MDLLVHDVSQDARRESKRSAGKASVRLRGVVVRGLPVREHADRIWLRSGRRLQWLDAASFADAPAAH